MGRFKKHLSVLTTAILVAIGLVAAPTSAQAFADNDIIVGVVGTSIDAELREFSCYPPEGVTPTYIAEGTLPPGITLNSTNGKIQGTYTQAGTFTYSGNSGCEWTQNGIPYSQKSPQVIEFEVYAQAGATPQAPSLTVEALGNADCDVRITGSVPAEQDPRSLKLTMWSNSRPTPKVVTLREQPADTPFTLTFSPDYNFNQADSQKIRFSDSTWFDCNDVMSFSLSYQNQASPVATSPVRTAVTSFTVLNIEPVLFDVSVPDPLCTLSIDGWLDTTGDPGTRAEVIIEGEDSGNRMTIYPQLYENGFFDIDIPLADMTQYDSTDSGELAGDSTALRCGEWYFADAEITVNGQIVSGGTEGTTMLFCDAGTYKNGNVCAPAPAGSFVPAAGMTEALGCEKGTFQSLAGATSCLDAPKGFFVATKRATAATACPAGQTTLGTASTSARDCYVLKNQTFKTLKAPKVLKYGKSVTVPIVTDNNLPLAIVFGGRCYSAQTTMKVKVGRVTRTVAALKITAGTEDTVCTLTLTNEGDAVYKPFTSTTSIRVSRTGR